MKRKKTVVTGRARGIDPYPAGPRAAIPRAALGRDPGGRRPASRARPAVAAEAEGQPPSVDLSVDLAPRRPGELILENPILVASGVVGYGLEYAEAVDIDGPGAICSRGTTLKARGGNPAPRMSSSPAALLNGIGLQCPGIDAVLERHAETWATWRTRVVLNVAGGSVEDYVGVARKVEGVPGIAALELNLSCPDAARGGVLFALDADGAAAVTAAARAATTLPLLVKLSAAAQDVRVVARAVASAGADALTAVNTLPGLAIDRERRRVLLGSTYGGLSGPALKPVALRAVYEIAQVVDIPVIGAGGIGTLDDVLDFLMAGARAVQVGTAVLADPALPIRLVGQLRTWCAEEGLGSYHGIVGAALPVQRERPSTKGVEYRP